ncbi:MAG: ATP-binding protein, partial [Gemmatimonadota bacterium]|nr:ATP-binding protein [Gemmatimonadota bacterium]
METMFNSISDGIVVADVTGKSFYVNPAAEQITGMDITDCPPEEWVERYGLFYPDRETPMRMEDLPFLRIISHGESMDEVDMFIRNQNRPDGVYIRVSGRPLLDNLGGIRGGVIIFRDVTEHMLAEEALAQAFAQGRLEVMDTILHNIGNAINSVTTGIETVRQHLGNDRVGRRLFALAAAVREHQDDWSDYIENDPQGRKVMPFIIELSESFSKRNEELTKTVGRVWDRANHIADIVRTQKAFSSPTTTRKDIDLHDALSAAVRVLRDSLNKKGIRTDIDCEDAPREIRIQESQFHQMLVNLVKNSIEAIDDLTLAQGLDETPRIQIRASTKNDVLDLEVSDNGIGIKSKDTKVIFAPGYTTKRLGSGLGLHSAANFVIASGGRIQALSKGTGKGTTMRVRLPLSSVAPQANGRAGVSTD